MLECPGNGRDYHRTAGTEVVQVMTAEAMQAPASSPMAPETEKPKVCKLLKREGDSKALILKLDGKEEWFPLTDDGKKNIVRLADGQNVKLDFQNVNGVYHLKMLLPADENGKYDRDGWAKTSSGAGKGSGGWSNKQKSPEERRSIERQKAADLASQIYIACIGKSAEPVPKNYDEMVSAVVRGAETIARFISKPEGQQ